MAELSKGNRDFKSCVENTKVQLEVMTQDNNQIGINQVLDLRKAIGLVDNYKEEIIKLKKEITKLRIKESS